jgi:hypothetical protein
MNGKVVPGEGDAPSVCPLVFSFPLGLAKPETLLTLGLLSNDLDGTWELSALRCFVEFGSIVAIAFEGTFAIVGLDNSGCGGAITATGERTAAAAIPTFESDEGVSFGKSVLELSFTLRRGLMSETEFCLVKLELCSVDVDLEAAGAD